MNPSWGLGRDILVATEHTGMYLLRVPAVNTHPGSPSSESEWVTSGFSYEWNRLKRPGQAGRK